MGKPQTKWTLPEKLKALDMRAAGIHLRDIALALGRTYGSVDAHLRKEEINQRRRERTRREKLKDTPHLNVVKTISVPKHLWIERDYRSNEPRTTTQELMGDPPRKQSALTPKLAPAFPAPRYAYRGVRLTLAKSAGEFALYVPPALEDEELEAVA